MGFFNFNPSKPVPKAPVKPAPPVKPRGLFGEKNEFTLFKNMNQFARKLPSSTVPGTIKKMFRADNEKAVGRLQQYAGKYLNKKVGVSPADLGDPNNRYSILGKMAEGVAEAKRRSRWAEAKQLQEDIKIFSKWKEGFK